MSKVSLGINTGFAVNRYPTAKEWLKVVSDAGLKRLQITADMVDPRYPNAFIDSEIEAILASESAGGPSVTSAFTGAFTRLNLFGHPNHEIREYWFNWYKQFIKISSRLGAQSVGGHLSIISLQDDGDTESRANRLQHIIKCWVDLSNFAIECGIPTMIWEPMSISREFGETLEAAEEIQSTFETLVGRERIKICLDVDHGDIESKNPSDTDPYAWIKRFASSTHCIHMKQSLANKSGHWPFTEDYNKLGRIQKNEFISHIRTCFDDDLELFLELSFRERNPTDYKAPQHIKHSVDYWVGEPVSV